MHIVYDTISLHLVFLPWAAIPGINTWGDGARARKKGEKCWDGFLNKGDGKPARCCLLGIFRILFDPLLVLYVGRIGMTIHARGNTEEFIVCSDASSHE